MQTSNTRLHGYDLVLRCTKCSLKKRIRHFPSAMNLLLGTILGAESQTLWEKGCLRCGTCQFEVMSAPLNKPEPSRPVGWAK